MDSQVEIEKIRKLALDAEREYSKAVKDIPIDLNEEDDEGSISSVLDNLEILPNSGYLETHLNSKYFEEAEIAALDQLNCHEEPNDSESCSEPSEISLRSSILEYIVGNRDSGNILTNVEEPPSATRTCGENLMVPGTSQTSSHNSKENIQLNYIWEELISTEFEYLKSLNFLHMNFLRPIKKILRTKGEVKISEKMCNYIKMIYRFGSHFLDDLVQVEFYQVGRIFLHHRTLFNLYTKLSRLWNTFMKIIKESPMETYIKRLEAELQEAMGFTRYMLKPMQRLAKYELFLNQMLKNLGHEANDKIVQIENAREFIKQILNRCNTIVALDSIEYQKYSVEETGNYISKTDLKWKVHRKKKKKLVTPIELFIFEKVVIFAVNVEGALQYRDSILLSKLFRRDLPHPSKFTLEEIQTYEKPTRVFKLEAANRQIKEKCIQCIDDLLWEELKRIKQTNVQLYQI